MKYFEVRFLATVLVHSTDAEEAQAEVEAYLRARFEGVKDTHILINKETTEKDKGWE